MADGQTEQAKKHLGEMLRLMGLEADIEVREEEARIILEVRGPEMGLVIGKKGQTLEALQYLVSKMVNREGGESTEGKPIVVDTEGYRQRREEALVEMAHRLGEKAVKTGRTITCDPMTPQERRIVHLALDKVPGVTTRSEGEGIHRRLLIVPDKDKVVPNDQQAG